MISDVCHCAPDTIGAQSIPSGLGMPKAFYRRNLPHLQRDNKPHFVTFCTHLRWILPGTARDVALGSCLHDNDTKIDIKRDRHYA